MAAPGHPGHPDGGLGIEVHFPALPARIHGTAVAVAACREASGPSSSTTRRVPVDGTRSLLYERAHARGNLLYKLLRNARGVLLWKLEGLSGYDIRRPMTPTGTNLLGLVKHCAGGGVRVLRRGDGPAVSGEDDLDWHGDEMGGHMYATAAESREQELPRPSRLTRFGTRSSLPRWTPGYRCQTCRKPPRTPIRERRTARAARGSLDRHATYIVAAYVAGAAR